ncbi:MAG TPA: EAL domain-containing protein [Xanthomonadaceae bacterium]|nr:EAL domain-containing protein [Xanthomonadaceae bacterium]
MATIRRELFPGEVLFRQGDPAGCAWLVESGEVELRVDADDVPATPHLQGAFGPGELIGELALLDGAPYRATAVARDDAVLLAIDADQFAERIESSDPIVRAMVDSLRGRVRALQEALPAGTPLPLEDEPCDDPEDRAGIAKIRFETQLREALDTGSLEVHYQPIYDLQAGRVGGYEALVRWAHDELGQVSPAEFIHLAEETSLIVPLGEYVLDRAVEVLRGLHATLGDAVPSIAVNLSARQLVQPGMARQVVSRAAQAGLPKGALKLEITESRMLDYGPVAAVMAHCRSQGVPFALDDFGTGYSNLTHLHELEFEYVKVDQAFCRHMLDSRRAMAIVEAIIAMAHGIGAQVIMEGVETRAQLAELRRMGVRHAQGWLVGKAQPADAVLSGAAAAVTI